MGQQPESKDAAGSVSRDKYTKNIILRKPYFKKFGGRISKKMNFWISSKLHSENVFVYTMRFVEKLGPPAFSIPVFGPQMAVS